jgi:thiamine pyrophosphate-dependent acetolactate synthase large subunit-like protein
VIDPTDIALLAQAKGCKGVNVDSVRGLESALSAPRSSDRPLVLGATIDPSQYAAQF